MHTVDHSNHNYEIPSPSNSSDDSSNKITSNNTKIYRDSDKNYIDINTKNDHKTQENQKSFGAALAHKLSNIFNTGLKIGAGLAIFILYTLAVALFPLTIAGVILTQFSESARQREVMKLRSGPTVDTSEIKPDIKEVIGVALAGPLFLSDCIMTKVFPKAMEKHYNKRRNQIENQFLE